jgi:hypothetical protein
MALLLITGCASLDGPRMMVEGFYATDLVEYGGLPNWQELQQLEPFLSKRLHARFAAMMNAQEEWIRRNPGPLKPPYILSGDVFTSLVEWPSHWSGERSFKVTRVVAQPDGSWHVSVRFWYQPKREGWVDVVVVRREEGRFVIDDVLYSDAGPDHIGGRLSDRLELEE